MDNIYPSHMSAEDNINDSNPHNGNIQRRSNYVQQQIEICVIDSSPEELEHLMLTDQVDSAGKAINSAVTDYICKEDDNKSSTLDIVNCNDAQKLATFDEGITSCSHSEIKSRHEPQSVLCPRVNCPEKIIICLDLHEEMDSTIFRSRAGDKYTGLELAKRAIKMFVMHKTQMNPRNEFAFLIFHEESTVIHSFTARAQDMLNTLDEIEIETQKSGPLNISHLFETIKENIELPIVKGDPKVIPPPYVVRVILVFGRSHCVPVVTSTKVQRELESSPYFFTDVLYIHNPPSSENKCEEIFHKLCDLDHNGLSYIFEQSKYTPILNSGAKLLAHPLQRPRQLEAMYKIGTPISIAPTSVPAE